MARLQRVGISLESELLEKFDKLIGNQGYANRSEAIRDLVREKLTSQQLAEPQSEAVAAVFVVYDHHRTGISHKIADVQHSHVLKTISSLHVHLDHHNCLEVILLRGKVNQITKLADNLVSLKGVKLGRVNLMTTD